MPDDDTVEAAVLSIAEDLAEVFDLPQWQVVRKGGLQDGRWLGPHLRSDRYVGRDGSTPADFRREVQAAFDAAGLRTVEVPGVGDGGWLVGRAEVDGVPLCVRSKGAIEILVG